MPRRLFAQLDRTLPFLVAGALTLLALRPMLFNPNEKMLGTLASMAGAGLSFASVGFAAANNFRGREGWSRMSGVALMFFRFSVTMALALAFAALRESYITDFSHIRWVEYLLRGIMVLLTAAGIFMAFLGFRTLVRILAPTLEEDARALWRSQPDRDAPGEPKKSSAADSAPR